MSSDRLQATSAPGRGALHLGPLQWLELIVLTGLHLVRLIGLPFAAWAARFSAGRGQTMLPAEARRPVLFFYSQVAWDEVWQRPQEFALRLARHFDVIFFGPLQMHRRFGATRSHHYRQRIAAGTEQLLAVTPRTFSGTYKNGWIHALNRLLLRWEARLVCPVRPDVVVTNSPFPDWLPEELEPQLLVYDFMDDFIAFDWAPPEAAARQERLLSRADLLLAGTHFLAEKYSRASGRPCEYVPSGVDAKRWTAAADRAREEPLPGDHPLAKFPARRIGYAGSISSRMNPGVIHALSEAFPEGSLLLAGPIYGPTAEKLHGPNVHFLGSLPPSELPDIVARFDVALIPFHLNEATRALNPIKAMEYLAAGVPIVSTPLPDVVEEFGEVVETATEPPEFVEAVRRVLALPADERAARVRAGQELVARRTWQQQGDRFASLIQGALDRRAPAGDTVGVKNLGLAR